MGNRMTNIATIGAGGLFGLVLVAGFKGTLLSAWSFFFDGLIQHYLTLQTGLFNCF